MRTVHDAVAEFNEGQGAVLEGARILAYVTGTVDQELLARNEYLAAENRILKAQLNGRPRLSDAERGVLGETGHRLGRKVLAEIATVARPTRSLFGIASSSPTSSWLDGPAISRQAPDQAGD